MRALILTTLAALPLSVGAPGAIGTASALDTATALATARAVPSTQDDDAKTLVRPGRLVPADLAEIRLQPKAGLGSTTFTEVLEHGSPVTAGQVIARLDPEAQQDKVEAAEKAVEEARDALQQLRERHRMAEENSAAKLEKSERELQRSALAVDEFLKFELPMRRRSEEMSRRSRQANIDDQQEELAQLQSMYGEDELTDATEEIVLQRARRALALSMESARMSEERSEHQREVQEPLEIARKRESLVDAQRALRHQQIESGFEADARAKALESAQEKVADAEEALADARADLASMELRAPRDGVLWHGEPAVSTGTRHTVGSAAPLNTPCFVVADPDRWKVSLDIPEASRRDLASSTAVRVTLAYLGERELAGTMEVERHPSARSAGGPENLYDAEVTLSEARPGLSAGMRAQVHIPVGDGE